MNVFSQSKWIWFTSQANDDEYGEFFTRFQGGRKKTVCRISTDFDYTLFINGAYVSSNQYGDFEWHKSYDELDITPYVRDGENALAILVWHHGEDTQRYVSSAAGLLFEVCADGEPVVSSGTDTLCRKSKAYRSGGCKLITRQLGFGFHYDSVNEDDWMVTGRDCLPAVLVEKHCKMIPRPIKKAILTEKKASKLLQNDGTWYLVDLGAETVGLPTFSFYSPCEQDIRVDFGEDLQNGSVRRLIGERDFSFTYRAKKGKNEYVNYMLRLGCRYLEMYTEKPVELEYLGVIPQEYPVKEKPVKLDDPLDGKIYELCVNTLRLCMMEHYVDCPWREQCLYAFDSRNQMLSGYYAFEGGNAEYARANLLLMREDRRKDGLLSICFPCGTDMTIPSFSLYYFIAIEEYVSHTGDRAFIREIMPKLQSILKEFVNNRKDGLVSRFCDPPNWNFYDWTEKMSNEKARIPDLIINGLFIIALEKMRVLCELSGEPFEGGEMIEETRKAARKAFYRPATGLFALTAEEDFYNELGNAFAVLAGLADETQSAHICEKLAKNELDSCSLSMKPFKYDALLKVDREGYQATILQEIRKTYKRMLDAGATATWETAKGAEDFGNAGSLCHGWSAIPVYYYHLFGLAKTE